MSLWDRPNGPTSGAASVANQTGMNVQAAQSGPLPALLVLAGTAETLVPSPENPAVPLSIQLAPDTAIEQTLFDVVASGIVTTKNNTNITFKVYEGVAISAGNLMGTSGAIAVNTKTANWWAKLQLMLNSVSGALDGQISFYVNGTLVATVVISNILTGFLNQGNPSANPPTVANMPQFCISATSSAADGTHQSTINVQKFSCG